VLEINGVGKKYSSSWALADVTVSLNKGEISGLLGANGAGKSTLLKILAGYFYPTCGTVRRGEHDLRVNPALWRRSTGFLPEGAPLPPRKKVREILIEQYSLFFGSLLEEKELDDFMSHYGLDRETAHKPVKELSRGYRQRTGLALAETGRPELLLLDEPFSGLDPTQVRQLRKRLKEAKENRITLFSSHILQEVYTLCDRIIILHEGRIRACVEKREFNNWEELDALYSRLIEEAVHE
jgi:ABC-2 type transport system ATP-binding protein